MVQKSVWTYCPYHVNFSERLKMEKQWPCLKHGNWKYSRFPFLSNYTLKLVKYYGNVLSGDCVLKQWSHHSNCQRKSHDQLTLNIYVWLKSDGKRSALSFVCIWKKNKICHGFMEIGVSCTVFILPRILTSTRHPQHWCYRKRSYRLFDGGLDRERVCIHNCWENDCQRHEGEAL